MIAVSREEIIKEVDSFLEEYITSQNILAGLQDLRARTGFHKEDYFSGSTIWHVGDKDTVQNKRWYLIDFFVILKKDGGLHIEISRKFIKKDKLQELELNYSALFNEEVRRYQIQLNDIDQLKTIKYLLVDTGD